MLDNHKDEIIAAFQSGKVASEIKEILDKKNIESGFKISTYFIDIRLFDWGQQKKREKLGPANLEPYTLQLIA